MINILIISITINWVYKLYEEYITSLNDFILNNYNDININQIYYDINIFTNFDNIKFSNYDKIFYTGDLEILKIIIHKINYNYNKFYFINIEQMSHPSYYKMIRRIDQNINIIDYSEENIPFFQNIYKKIYLFPPYFKNNIDITNKHIDILSISNNQYRSNILKKINKNDLNIVFIDNIYANERDKYFADSKIYINIHCSDDHKTMELIRISNLIINKVIIISQNSINNNLLFLNKYIIIVNDLNDLNEYINDTTMNYTYYFNKIYGNFNESEYIEYIKHNVDKIIFE